MLPHSAQSSNANILSLTSAALLLRIRRFCLVGDKFTKPYRAIAARCADHLADLGPRDVGKSLEGAGNGGRVQLGKGR